MKVTKCDICREECIKPSKGKLDGWSGMAIDLDLCGDCFQSIFNFIEDLKEKKAEEVGK